MANVGAREVGVASSAARLAFLEHFIVTRYNSALIFLVTMIAGGSLLLSARAQDGPLLSLSEGITALSTFTLHACGLAVERHDRVISAARGGFSMRVDNDCNGAWAHLIFLASILAYPASWKQKLLGLTIGEPLLLLLNIFRVASLFVVGVYLPSLFRPMHVYVWQFLIIGLALVLLFVWVDRFVESSG